MTDTSNAVSNIKGLANQINDFLGVTAGFPANSTNHTSPDKNKSGKNHRSGKTGKQGETPNPDSPGFFQQAINLVSIGVTSNLDGDPAKAESDQGVDALDTKPVEKSIDKALAGSAVGGLLLWYLFK